MPTPFAPSLPTLPRLAGALALLVLGAGCSSDGGESCGPDGAAGDIVVTDTGGSGAELRFHQLRARINNDCPAADAPAGVISVTISGVAVGGATPLTFCVPRPDLLDGTRPLGKDGSTNTAEVQLIDVTAAAAGCTYRKLRGATPSGTLTASGVCDDGRDQAGFALELAGEVDIERTCGAAVDILRMSLTGKVAVARSDS